MVLENFNVDFTESEVRERLKLVFKEEHQELLSKCLTELLGDDHKMIELVLKASMGITPKLEHKAGDAVLIETRHLSSWQMDIPTMTKEGMIEEDESLICIITTAKPFSRYPYHVKYEYINDRGERHTGTATCLPSHVKAYEEFPGD